MRVFLVQAVAVVGIGGANGIFGGGVLAKPTRRIRTEVTALLVTDVVDAIEAFMDRTRRQRTG